MSKRVLYQWVGTDLVESFSIFGCFAQRLMAYKKLDYKVVDAKIPKDFDYLEKEFKVLNVKWNFVVLQMLEEKITGHLNILSIIEERFPKPAIKSENVLNQAKSDLMHSWCWDVFYWDVSFLRWMESQNRELLALKILKDWEPKDQAKAMNIIFPNIQNFYQGRFDLTDSVSSIRDRVFSYFDFLEELLKENGYFSGPKMGLSDISMFVCFQALITSDVKSKICLKKYSAIVSWLKNVDYETQNGQTIPLKLDKM